MTQRDRVLAMLQAAGGRGVHTFELRREFIGNPSQRIAELEARGHRIDHTRERLNGDAVGTRYRLVSGGAKTAPVGGTAGDLPAAAAVPPESTLFDAADVRRPLSPYDQEAA